MGTFPAACQVLPAVSSFFSISNRFESPDLARWYRQETPTTPPPITIILEYFGNPDIMPPISRVKNKDKFNFNYKVKFFKTKNNLNKNF